MVLFYLERYQPEMLADITIKMDILELTTVSRNEHERLNKIKRLNTIGILEKEVLINHNVFIGATAQMMEYAIGLPKHVLKSNINANLLYYVYFLASEKKPTFFEVICNTSAAKGCTIECTNASNECKIPDENKVNFVLNKAYRRSAIDLSNPDNNEDSK